ncbi:hypothetical protein GCM10012286_76270 [Streptomyces lasiicapitis]|uniref:Uncharacterized protein n=1 Tax=Streptomyces lasiicapitis TaxID=1923961 RepID=A0ABQ2MUA8_9ACTN|nr:hypothetical protein GCM10012286_76270 [Streptomyces lasiicapitis]
MERGAGGTSGAAEPGAEARTYGETAADREGRLFSTVTAPAELRTRFARPIVPTLVSIR